jgi:hypothetical protein
MLHQLTGKSCTTVLELRLAIVECIALTSISFGYLSVAVVFAFSATLCAVLDSAQIVAAHSEILQLCSYP